jgi:hypothetical protein
VPARTTEVTASAAAQTPPTSSLARICDPLLRDALLSINAERQCVADALSTASRGDDCASFSKSRQR